MVLEDLRDDLTTLDEVVKVSRKTSSSAPPSTPP